MLSSLVATSLLVASVVMAATQQVVVGLNGTNVSTIPCSLLALSHGADAIDIHAQHASPHHLLIPFPAVQLTMQYQYRCRRHSQVSLYLPQYKVVCPADDQLHLCREKSHGLPVQLPQPLRSACGRECFLGLQAGQYHCWQDIQRKSPPGMIVQGHSADCCGLRSSSMTPSPSGSTVSTMLYER